jgi:hypothetical protein
MLLQAGEADWISCCKREMRRSISKDKDKDRQTQKTNGKKRQDASKTERNAIKTHHVGEGERLGNEKL